MRVNTQVSGATTKQVSRPNIIQAARQPKATMMAVSGVSTPETEDAIDMKVKASTRRLRNQLATAAAGTTWLTDGRLQPMPTPNST